MKYYQVNFRLTPYNEDFADVLTALAADLGFESFMPTDEGVIAYIQQRLYVEDTIGQLCSAFPLPGVTVEYTTEEAEDKNWNAEWEASGFEPIVIDSRLCVHDTLHNAPTDTDIDLCINPRQAFGSGTHPTTRTLLTTLLDLPLKGKKIVDAGCGTGVLGILCAMLGAKHVMAYDIDNWSVENTLDNLTLNHLGGMHTEGCFEVREGDCSVLRGIGEVDLLIANIFREIILADLPAFIQTLQPHAQLLLSGFYDQDAPAIIEAAAHYGFRLVRQTMCEEWAVLLLER